MLKLGCLTQALVGKVQEYGANEADFNRPKARNILTVAVCGMIIRRNSPCKMAMYIKQVHVLCTWPALSI